MTAGVIAPFGWTFGIVPHTMASIVGFAALLHASIVTFLPPSVAADATSSTATLLGPA